jgi:hypothetical protein
MDHASVFRVRNILLASAHWAAGCTFVTNRHGDDSFSSRCREIAAGEGVSF